MIQFIVGSRLFISYFEKQKSGIQLANSSDSLNKISLSNTPSTRKSVYKKRKQEIQILRCLNSLIAQNIRECFISSKNIRILRKNMDMTVRCASLSLINGSDETLWCESLSLSRVHLIEDGALKFFHVAHEEETPRNACHLIFLGHSECVHVSTGVHRALLISDAITTQMKGWD